MTVISTPHRRQWVKQQIQSLPPGCLLKVRPHPHTWSSVMRTLLWLYKNMHTLLSQQPRPTSPKHTHKLFTMDFHWGMWSTLCWNSCYIHIPQIRLGMVERISMRSMATDPSLLMLYTRDSHDTLYLKSVVHPVISVHVFAHVSLFSCGFCKIYHPTPQTAHSVTCVITNVLAFCIYIRAWDICQTARYYTCMGMYGTLVTDYYVTVDILLVLDLKIEISSNSYNSRQTEVYIGGGRLLYAPTTIEEWFWFTDIFKARCHVKTYKYTDHRNLISCTFQRAQTSSGLLNVNRL